MWLQRKILLSCIAVVALSGSLCAQVSREQSSAVVIRLAARNPVIADVQRLAPPKLSDIVSRLEPLEETGPRQYVVRDGTIPTDAEKAQIAANPDFALAFDNYPLATLTLLRSVNDILRKARDGPP